MNPIDFVKHNVMAELIQQGLSAGQAESVAIECVKRYKSATGFSVSAMHDIFVYAGQLAAARDPKFKFKVPKKKTQRRTKRPPDAPML